MDAPGIGWYFSRMTRSSPIPVFTLYGETGQFPDVVHSEEIADRGPDLGWTIRPHRHSQMAQVFVIVSGGADANVDGQSLGLTGPAFLFLPAGVVHSFRFAPGTDGLVQSFPLAVLQEMAPDGGRVGQALARTVSGPAGARLSGLSRALHDTLGDTGTFRTEVAMALAWAVLACVAESAAADSPAATAAPRIARLEELIVRHRGEGWSAADYAAALSVSTGHLNRLCQAARGVGTTGLVEAVTMDEACRLLAFTRMSVAEVGYRLGYGDPSYFSRRFRRARGETPAAYRRRLHGA